MDYYSATHHGFTMLDAEFDRLKAALAPLSAAPPADGPMSAGYTTFLNGRRSSEVGLIDGLRKSLPELIDDTIEGVTRWRATLREPELQLLWDPVSACEVVKIGDGLLLTVRLAFEPLEAAPATEAPAVVNLADFKRDPDPDVVKVAEDLLEMARRGEIRALAYAVVKPGQTTGTAWQLAPDASNHAMHSAAHSLAHRIMCWMEASAESGALVDGD